MLRITKNRIQEAEPNMLCVIAKLDDAATEKLAALRRIAAPGGKPLYGHITIAVYTGDDNALFIRSCRELLRGIAPFEITYSGIEVLEETSIIVAAPAENESLCALHRRIADVFDASLDRWTKAGVWYPHTTLYFGSQADLCGIADRMRASFLPFSARIERIEFSLVLKDGYQIVDALDLSP